MKFRNDGPQRVCENMKRDAALLDQAEHDSGFEATLRVFTFKPAGITLGRTQDPTCELDLERCRGDGVDWAVRPTGGRAIFHEHEWTYSLTCRIDDAVWGGSRSATYYRCSALIVRSLRRLGVAADLCRPTARPDALQLGLRAAPPCFASTARHEITLAGRKLVGSAQRRLRHALLQQGSVLLGPGHLRISEYLAYAEETRAAERRRLEACSTDAGAALRAVSLGDWALALEREMHVELDDRTGSVAGTPAIYT